MATPVPAQQPPLVAQRDQRYYVGIKDAERGRVGYLLGPYDTHGEALANVKRAGDMAEDVDAWATFYNIGTCSVPADKAIRTVFGH